MPTTPRLKIPYPSENANPWFDSFEDMTNAFDAALYASREDRNIVYSGGGTVTFNSGSGVLAWSANIDIFSPLTGFIWRVAAGNVTLADGQCCFITLSRAPQTTGVYTLTVGTIVPSDLNGDSQLLVAWRHGTIVHFRGGYSIHNGSSISIFDAEPGGGGGGGTPGGSSGDVQVNNAGAFAGVSPGTAGNVLTSTGSGWASTAPGGGSIVYAAQSSDVSLTTGGFVDLVSLSISGTAFAVFGNAATLSTSGSATPVLQIQIDGSGVEELYVQTAGGTSFAAGGSIHYYATGLSAGAHTVKLRAKTTFSTATVNASTDPGRQGSTLIAIPSGGGGGGGSGALLALVGLRLTLTSGVPITTTDVVGAGTIYFTPLDSGEVATYDTGTWVMHSFSEKSLALTVTSGSNYDVFIDGTGTMSLSAAWTNSTTRANAIGTQDGVAVLGSDHSKRHIGTIRASGTNTCEDSAAKGFLWNRYNAKPRFHFNPTESANTWAITGAAGFTQANSNAANQFEYVSGDAATLVRADVYAMGNDGTAGGVTAGIGIDSSTVNSARYYGTNSPSATAARTDGTYAGYPGLGYHAIRWINASDNSSTAYGDANNPTYYQMGLSGEINR